MIYQGHQQAQTVGWNQKSLDYEIETDTATIQVPSLSEVEIKSLSITRLKQHPLLSVPPPILLLKSKASRLRDWNDTQKRLCNARYPVEIKSISITRLKQKVPLWFERSGGCWNQKHLDYEIETKEAFSVAIVNLIRWNQKHLDYEIETRTTMNNRISFKGWNQKSLDYEIETGINQMGGKPSWCWNQKSLDYEIETLCCY